VIRCWDIKQGECVAELLGHQGPVWSLSLDLEGHLVSGSFDATVRVWEIRSGRCIREIVMPRLYEGMLLRDVRGLNPSSKVVLQRLGARVL
jgi:WD40 repeat protein